MNRKGKMVALSVVAVLCLVGCGNIENAHDSSSQSIEILKTSESTVPASSVVVQEPATEEASAEKSEGSAEEKGDLDIARMLADAEQEATILENKLAGDASLTQAAMNDLSYEIYMVWDDLLNELWGILKECLGPEDMDKLLQEQRAWITEKEAEVKAAGKEYGGGSMAALASNLKAAELTQARVAVLAEYLQEK